MWHGADSNSLAYHLGEIDSRVSNLERDMANLKHWALRVSVLAGLWLVAIFGNIKSDTMAELIVAVLKKL
jgi:hypothetical protein